MRSAARTTAPVAAIAAANAISFLKRALLRTANYPGGLRSGQAEGVGGLPARQSGRHLLSAPVVKIRQSGAGPLSNGPCGTVHREDTMAIARARVMLRTPTPIQASVARGVICPVPGGFHT